MSFGKGKRIVNFTIDDYVIRMVENNGKDVTSIRQMKEVAVPLNCIEDGKITDDLAFFHFVKEMVDDWGIKHRKVRFYVPESLVIMREIELPENVQKEKAKEYITMEISHTIHFPFSNPVFDLYNVGNNDVEKKVTVLAAPEEELIKYTEIFADAKLKPVAIDVEPIGIYRYFLHKNGGIEKDKVFMFLVFNLTSIHLSIFHKHALEFMRYQPLSVTANDWQPTETDLIEWTFTGEEIRLQGDIEDQLNEIDRLMNFYRFSIHQGEKQVTDIVLLGDFPYLDSIKQQIELRYNIPTTLLHVEHDSNDRRNDRFIPALGLALKGGR